MIEESTDNNMPLDPNRDRRDLGLMGGPLDGRLSGPLPENPLLRAGLALAGANTWLKQGLLPPEAAQPETTHARR